MVVAGYFYPLLLHAIFMIVNCAPLLTEPQVQTKYVRYIGKQFDFEGKYGKTHSVVQFLGIRYAVSGRNNRWEKPASLTIPNSPDQKEVRATEMGHICPQTFDDEFTIPRRPDWPPATMDYMSTLLMTNNMSEDCLYLNIYLPMELYRNKSAENEYETKLPVMVYFHGHTFMEGSGNFYDGSVLSSFGRVVVVTFNYRVGALGFLSYYNGDVAGNFGLWDQLAALTWIKGNIVRFGGDVTRITAFGAGSGAISINLLMLTFQADKLFHHAILQSGTALSSTAIVNEPSSRARNLAKKLQCSDTEFIGCLKDKHWKDLVSAHKSYELFGPVIDGDLIKNVPREMMKNGEYVVNKMLIGICQEDGYGYVKENNFDGPAGLSSFASASDTKNDFSMAVDAFVSNFYDRATSTERATQVIRKMIEYVYQDVTVRLTPKVAQKAMIDIYTDHQWLGPAIETSRLTYELEQSTYFYTFGYRSGMNQKQPPWLSAANGAEIPFVFGYPFMNTRAAGLFPYQFSDTDRMVSKGVMDMWANFARSGNPTDDANSGLSYVFNSKVVNWPKYDDVQRGGLNISSSFDTFSNYRYKETKFWSDFIPGLLSTFAERTSTAAIPMAQIPNTEKKVTPTWTPSTSFSTFQSAGSSPGGRKSESSMSPQLTLTLAIGFVLLFANIIAYSFVSYLVQKEKFKTKKLRHALQEKNRLLDAELRERGMITTSATVCCAEPGSGCKATEDPLGGANTTSADSTCVVNKSPPLRCMASTAPPQAIRNCVVVDKSSVSVHPSSSQKRPDTNPSSLDESQTSELNYHDMQDLRHSKSHTVIQHTVPHGIKREVASLDGRFDGYAPDYKFKTYNGRSNIRGATARTESYAASGGLGRKPTSLWSIASCYGTTLPRVIGHRKYHPGHRQANESPSYSLHQQAQVLREEPLDHDQSQTVVPEVTRHVNGNSVDARQVIKSLHDKSRVGSQILGSETEGTVSSESDHNAGYSYCVTNNKMNVVTKL